MIVPAVVLAAALAAQTPPSSAAPAHVVNTFRFRIAAPLARVAPLFGPEGERAGAGQHWNPVFLYPQPAKDIEGAVFTVEHGQHTSVWVNTRFDLSAGRIQYVSLIDGVLVSVIDVRLTAPDASHTAVEVTYARTALDAANNDIVENLGAQDRTRGLDWQKEIKAALGLVAIPSGGSH
jgi:hypothetical protein